MSKDGNRSLRAHHCMWMLLDDDEACEARLKFIKVGVIELRNLYLRLRKLTKLEHYSLETLQTRNIFILLRCLRLGRHVSKR